MQPRPPHLCRILRVFSIQGRVVEVGSHEQLYALGGDYKRRCVVLFLPHVEQMRDSIGDLHSQYLTSWIMLISYECWENHLGRFFSLKILISGTHFFDTRTTSVKKCQVIAFSGVVCVAFFVKVVSIPLPIICSQVQPVLQHPVLTACLPLSPHNVLFCIILSPGLATLLRSVQVSEMVAWGLTPLPPPD